VPTMSLLAVLSMITASLVCREAIALPRYIVTRGT
jgi:hypothetical protein